jgi:dTDP-glucose pyrophosphorylase
MKDWRSAFVAPDATLEQVISVMDASSLQICLVVDAAGKLLGTVTDGDIRRGIIRTHSLSGAVSEVMKRNPVVSSLDVDRGAQRELMARTSVRQLPLLDREGHVVGLILRDDLEAPEPIDNWVVLMAGGLGKRLRPMTDDTPKPLLQVGHKPLLETILESFVEHNFRRFFISVNYMAERVKEHIGDGSRWNVEVRYLEENAQLGTAGALGLVDEAIDSPLIVMNGDVLTKTNFAQLLAFHREQGARATMCVREYDVQVPFGVVDIDKGRVARLREKPVNTYFINAGIYVLEPDMLPLVTRGSALNMTDLFQILIDRGDQIAVFPVREYWLDIGQVEDFNRANGEYPRFFEKN